MLDPSLELATILLTAKLNARLGFAARLDTGQQQQQVATCWGAEVLLVCSGSESSCLVYEISGTQRWPAVSGGTINLQPGRVLGPVDSGEAR